MKDRGTSVAVITVKMIVLTDLFKARLKEEVDTVRRENLSSPLRFYSPISTEASTSSPTTPCAVCAVIVKFEMLFFIREMDFIAAESFKYKRKETCAICMHRTNG